MYQEAIDTLVGLLNQFPRTYKLEIIDHDHIIICVSDPDQEIEFESAMEMVEWLEEQGK